MYLNYNKPNKKLKKKEQEKKILNLSNFFSLNQSHLNRGSYI
jgi:hypothetical protein